MMSLGSYTFYRNPETCTYPQKRKRASAIETLGGVAYFSWGCVLPGQPLGLKWPGMETTMFDELMTLFEADVQVPFDPDVGLGTTYNVEIQSLLGEFLAPYSGAAEYKKNVELKLVIM
ncbi:MAG: hypothetical protein JRH18_23420, partial [Deltaproteobacteria bacterium]|nr:hypothetical protein [Deltaproteobacteria bacterium]